jgi:hypothetical protein
VIAGDHQPAAGPAQRRGEVERQLHAAGLEDDVGEAVTTSRREDAARLVVVAEITGAGCAHRMGEAHGRGGCNACSVGLQRRQAVFSRQWPRGPASTRLHSATLVALLDSPSVPSRIATSLASCGS